MNFLWSFPIVIVLLSAHAEGAAFTFELPDGDIRCFYNSLKDGERTKVEFQVNICFDFIIV